MNLTAAVASDGGRRDFGHRDQLEGCNNDTASLPVTSTGKKIGASRNGKEWVNHERCIEGYSLWTLIPFQPWTDSKFNFRVHIGSLLERMPSVIERTWVLKSVFLVIYMTLRNIFILGDSIIDTVVLHSERPFQCHWTHSPAAAISDLPEGATSQREPMTGWGRIQSLHPFDSFGLNQLWKFLHVPSADLIATALWTCFPLCLIPPPQFLEVKPRYRNNFSPSNSPAACEPSLTKCPYF